MSYFNNTMRRQIDRNRDLKVYHITYEGKERDGAKFIMQRQTIELPQEDVPEDEFVEIMSNHLLREIDKQMVTYCEDIKEFPDRVNYYSDDKVIVRNGDIIRIWPIIEEMAYKIEI